MPIKIIILIALFITSFSCNAEFAQTSNNIDDETNVQNLKDAEKLSPNLYKVSTGNLIRITNISNFDFPKSGQALVMHYKTSIPVENKTELRKEIDEIWEVFQKNVEAANVKGAAIRAVHDETSGFIKKGKGYGFVFLKRDSGEWYCLDDEKDSNQ